MNKCTLTEQEKQDFLDYAKQRINRCSHIKDYNHLTENILSKTFDFMVSHKLTVQENGSSYYIMSNSKEWLSLGYLGYSIGTIDSQEEMQENLFHEVFCKAEWIARSTRENYSDVCKAFIGRKAYQYITA